MPSKTDKTLNCNVRILGILKISIYDFPIDSGNSHFIKNISNFINCRGFHASNNILRVLLIQN